ncbi:MAG TPA: hypothetical protein VF748_14830 [Candidatus Acidoferrum sp.]
MRKALFVLLAMLPLSGCASLQAVFPNAPTPQQLITDAQNAAVAVCQFLPTAETVAGIIATGNPALATATAIANAICGAVSPKAVPGNVSVRRLINRSGAVPTVSGVPIYGQFIH